MINSFTLSHKKCLAIWLLVLMFTVPAAAQNVGINTTTPLAALHVDLGASLSNGVLFSGLDPSGGSFPSLGAGHRLMYYPGRGVFRAGYVEGTQWDNSQVGAFSFAFGYNTIAKGNGSTAFGDATYAGGTISTAFGNSTNTKGYSSFVMGMYNDPLITGPDEDVETPQTPLLIVGNGDGNSTRNNALTIFKNGDVLLRNYTTVLVDPGVKLPPVTGPGTRMMWLAEKSAFRLGTVHNNDWNADSIGTWSTGIGYSTKAKGQFSLALGLQTTASGITSTALGYNTKASGENSISTGSVTTASGQVSTAMGSGTLASGITSTALGYSTVASGENSIALGSVTKASGANTTAIGFKTYAASYGSLSLGRYNDTIVNANRTSWIGTDPLLIVGNGTSDAALHNAMVVYKNGSMVLKNPTTVLVNPGFLSPPISGPGTRMMWLPEKSALRIGTVHNDDWNADSIGTWSTGIGYSTKAKGLFSLALGLQTTASGATSTALGYSTKASGENSISMGSVTTASGANTTAMGFKTYASSYGSVSMGRFNDKIASSNATSWVAGDPLLIVGNGTSDADLHNTLVVYKNGNLVLKNPTTITLDPGVIPTPIDGTGTRMMWLPEKSAFRAGTTQTSSWDGANIGAWSLASGLNTEASGSVSTAFGILTKADGSGSTAMGSETISSGYSALATGGETVAFGSYSTAMGYVNRAMGAISSVSGHFNIAKGYASTVIGLCNDSILVTDQNSLDPLTPLFIIGNGDGTGVGQRRNAMVVRKDGHVGIGTNSPLTYLHVDVGSSITDGFLVRGDAYSYDATVPNLGDGSRMMFYPGKAAFRMGYIEGGAYWDNINVGQRSVGMGFNTTASGIGSIAMGAWAHASGNQAIAMGNGPVAEGTASIGLGWYTHAFGLASFSAGEGTRAYGDCATAMGLQTYAKGKNSFSMGYATIAKGYATMVVGMFNDSLLITNQTEVNDTTPLFMVGNGSSHATRNNAIVVYKNGITEVNGQVEINGNTDINGFTHLGNTSPNIKMKKLTGISASTQNAWTNIAHGLTMSKILSVNIIMAIPGFVNLPPSYTYQPGYEYQYQVATSNIVVINSTANSSNILNKAFTILIVYEE